MNAIRKKALRTKTQGFLGKGYPNIIIQVSKFETYVFTAIPVMSWFGWMLNSG